MEQTKYVIITPVRNEEKYIEKTLQSVIDQSITPMEWIIVNDGSSDRTQEIVENRMRSHGWITLVNMSDRGFAAVGKGVVESFYAGFKSIKHPYEWKFIAKLDGDLSIGNNYFEKLILRFEHNEKLGIAGGTCFYEENGTMHEEKTPTFHPIAAARLYRRTCFEEIGGLASCNAWDTIDLLRARTKGWETRRFADLGVIHYRLMSSRKGLWEGKKRTGRNLYLTGYSVLFLLARSAYRLFRKPYLIESAGVIYGYFRAMLKNEPLAVTPQEKAFLRREQRQRLLGFYKQGRGNDRGKPDQNKTSDHQS